MAQLRKKPTTKKQTTVKLPKDPTMVEVEATWLEGVLKERERALYELEALCTKPIGNVNECQKSPDEFVNTVILELLRYRIEDQNAILAACLTRVKNGRRSTINGLKRHLDEDRANIHKTQGILNTQLELLKELDNAFTG